MSQEQTLLRQRLELVGAIARSLKFMSLGDVHRVFNFCMAIERQKSGKREVRNERVVQFNERQRERIGNE